MKQQLTEKQKDIIIKHGLGKMYHVSMPDMALFADFYEMMVKNPDRYNSLSDITREGLRCLLHYGVDWRTNGKDDEKLDKILKLLVSGKLVIGDSDDEATKEEVGKLFNDEGGFFE